MHMTTKPDSIIKTGLHRLAEFLKKIFRFNGANHPKKTSTSMEVSTVKSTRTRKFKFVWSRKYEDNVSSS